MHGHTRLASAGAGSSQKNPGRSDTIHSSTAGLNEAGHELTSTAGLRQDPLCEGDLAHVLHSNALFNASHVLACAASWELHK